MKLQSTLMNLFLGALLVGVASAGKGSSSPDVDGAAELSVPCDDGDGGVEYVIFGCEWEANGSPSDSKSRRRKRNLRKNKEVTEEKNYIEAPEDEAAEVNRKLIATVTPEGINCLLNWRDEQYLFEDIGFPEGWTLLREEQASTSTSMGVTTKGDEPDFFKYVYSFSIDLGDEGTTSAKIELEFVFDDVGEHAVFDDQAVGISCPSK